MYKPCKGKRYKAGRLPRRGEFVSGQVCKYGVGEGRGDARGRGKTLQKLGPLNIFNLELGTTNPRQFPFASLAEGEASPPPFGG